MTRHSWHKLLNEESQETTADGSEVEVVDHEQTIQLEGWTIAHQLSAPKNDYVVCDDHQSTLLDGRHRRHTRFEFEVLWVVALDGREDLVEEWP